ncbi:azurin [Alteromonas pelagimontana]|uniref:Azurin n=1 Tax=Alteromonas pelagimontana TaxID=1858656 RepID=A0A6N3IVM3_9ALTE|nr:azurin [Alteromonas pelagimontana]QJR82925.1 azurin [Alteromonas pelagimontana]
MATSAMAAECEVNIDSTDAMKYDKNEFVIDKSCEEFTVNLTHSGKLPKNAMGHNVVITKASNAQAVASDGMTAGLDNDYIKPDDERVIAHTEIIGGGEKTSVTFQVDKIKPEEDYMFFCSFPGHIAVMKGTVKLQ